MKNCIPVVAGVKHSGLKYRYVVTEYLKENMISPVKPAVYSEMINWLEVHTKNNFCLRFEVDNEGSTYQSDWVLYLSDKQDMTMFKLIRAKLYEDTL
jgi:hypothetical protein